MHPKKACGGRISVTELPSEMGIGMEHLEARVEARLRVGSRTGENWAMILWLNGFNGQWDVNGI